MIQFIYPGRLFFLSPRLRSAIMKIQAVIFLFNSSALLNQAYSLRILPAYEAREHFNACKCWINFFFKFFFFCLLKNTHLNHPSMGYLLSNHFTVRHPLINLLLSLILPQPSPRTCSLRNSRAIQAAVAPILPLFR